MRLLLVALLFSWSVPIHTKPAPIVTFLLQTVNAERAGYGASQLTLNTRSSACALAHSWAMARVGRVFHDLKHDVCVRAKRIGENVGMKTMSPSVEQRFPRFAYTQAVNTIESAMFNEGPCSYTPCYGQVWESHGHYLYLIDPAWNTIGIGIVFYRHVAYVTEEFSEIS